MEILDSQNLKGRIEKINRYISRTLMMEQITNNIKKDMLSE